MVFIRAPNRAIPQWGIQTTLRSTRYELSGYSSSHARERNPRELFRVLLIPARVHAHNNKFVEFRADLWRGHKIMIRIPSVRHENLVCLDSLFHSIFIAAAKRTNETAKFLRSIVSNTCVC